jgi:uncharacterized SAM-binding protein YcdF (DUF218 family)
VIVGGEVMHARGRKIDWGVVAGAVAAALLVFGFLLFAARATRVANEPLAGADAIVVLTGEASRIQAGAWLLSAGRGGRMLISGVNRILTPADLRRITGLDKAVFACCVDIGYDARDTIGNAEEAHRWATEKGFRSLLLVTAAYHMPRSLAELTSVMPGVAIAPFPVPGRHLGDGNPWWLNAHAVRILAEEFLKVLVAAPRLALYRVRWFDQPHDLRPSDDKR